jgi:hypothetical protein
MAVTLFSTWGGGVRRLTLSIALAAVAAAPAAAQQPVAWWAFDEQGDTRAVRDRAGSLTDAIEGNVTRVRGVSGSAVRLDGFTSVIRRLSTAAPLIRGAFAAEAWVALATYPWNWAPLLDHERDGSQGYYFGIGPEGHAGLQLAVDGVWQTCRTERAVPLRKWTHVAASFDPQSGVTMYVDGAPAGTCAVRGTFASIDRLDLLIGMNHEKRVPSNPVRPQATLATWYTLDGIVDEIKLYAGARAAADIKRDVAAITPPDTPDIPPRRMPSGPAGPGRFGAYYTKLAYYPEWDALFRVSDHPDIVVQFDGSPIRVVFWRGTRYSPVWVMEDGTWMADQSAEHFTNHEGCFEHMLDPQNRYSHVRIIENTPARIVVHWRYAPVSVRQEFSQPDERTGWSDWIDEYFTFFPDGLGMRKVVMWTSGRPLGPSEFIILAQPGQRPEDIIHLDALTLVNLKGETQMYSWAGDTPDWSKEMRPANPLIQVVNLKSQHKPFEIFEPGARMRVFRHEQRKDASRFPWWNHWPEAQIPSDGRYAVAPDRPSHFSLSWGGPPIHKLTDIQYYATWMYGATLKPPSELAVLARSWAQAPVMKLTGTSFSGGTYDRSQRAYVVRRSAGDASPLAFTVAGSSESPVVNLSIVVEGWGTGIPVVELGGHPAGNADGMRYGHIRHIDRTDLIVWIPVSGMAHVSARISSAGPTSEPAR